MNCSRVTHLDTLITKKIFASWQKCLIKQSGVSNLFNSNDKIKGENMSFCFFSLMTTK